MTDYSHIEYKTHEVKKIMKQMKFKKGQAAMEFLMTYGWAILVVLAAIGALAYFGVLSPDRFLPKKCTMESGFGCVDFSITDGNSDGNGVLVVYLTNGLGYDLTMTTGEILFDSCTIN